jgi:glycerate kinase
VRIVVAPDKFKGTLTATEVAHAIVSGLRRVAPDAIVTPIPLADGGEGSLHAVVAGAGGEIQPVGVSDPLGRQVTAPVAFLSDGRAFVESASAIGVGLLAEPDPLRASSRGAGDLIMRAVEGAGVRPRIVVAVGGTSSTDAGTGAATAAGWRFLDSRGHELAPGGGALAELASIDARLVDRRLQRCGIVAACDVGNPLTGPRGAAPVFSPQKGAAPEAVEALSEGLDRLAEVVHRELGIAIASLPHGGAGGGLGGGLAAFFGANLVAGFDFVAGVLHLAEAIAGADLVITGEGRIDASTAEGKVVAGVARLAREAGVDCAAIAGEITPTVENAKEVLGLHGALSLVDRFGEERALTDASACISAAAGELFPA